MHLPRPAYAVDWTPSRLLGSTGARTEARTPRQRRDPSPALTMVLSEDLGCAHYSAVRNAQTVRGVGEPLDG
jgi:hypothetical protein